MAASAVIELDTTAPVVTILDARLVDGNLRLDFELDEPDLLGITLEGVGDGVLTGPGHALVAHGLTTGALLIHVLDEVGNEATHRIEYTVSGVIVTVKLARPAAFDGRLGAAARDGRVEGDRGGLRVRTVVTPSGRIVTMTERGTLL